jgi:hypothetical protein
MVAPSKSWGDKIGATGGNKGKSGSGGLGAGTAALMGGAGSTGYGKGPVGPTGKGAVDKIRSELSKQRAIRAEGGVGGGTTTTPNYVPGAVPNFPEADIPTVLEKIVAPMIPGLGGAIGAVTAGKMVTDDDLSKPTTLFGGDPGPQKGWQPDRFKGQANMSGVGDPGSASGEQSIPGKPYGAGTIALTGDEDEPTGAGTEQIYSDVTLRDRRKPKKVGAGTEIVLGA